MDPKVVVKYRGALAHYNIFLENEAIYQAQLIRYDGKPDQTPPNQVTLVKENEHWSGSSDKQDLLNKIGEVIEKRISYYNSFFSRRSDEPPTGTGPTR
jgi:nitric oxide synthase oxygenase domain/subunit